MNIFTYLDGIIQFHEDYNLPKQVFFYGKEAMKCLSDELHPIGCQDVPPVSVSINNKECVCDIIHYREYTFYLVNTQE